MSHSQSPVAGLPRALLLVQRVLLRYFWGRELRWAGWETIASGLSVLICPSVLAGRSPDIRAVQH